MADYDFWTKSSLWLIVDWSGHRRRLSENHLEPAAACNLFIPHGESHGLSKLHFCQCEPPSLLAGWLLSVAKYLSNFAQKYC